MPEAIEDTMAVAPPMQVDIDLFTDEELLAMLEEDGPYAGFADRPDLFDEYPDDAYPAELDLFADAPPDADETALAGRDGQRAGALLKGSVIGGRDTLHRIVADAVTRLLEDDDWESATTLFTDEELAEVQQSLAAVRANGDLLGRARVRRLAELANRDGEPVKFAEGYAAYDCPDCGGVAYNGDPKRGVKYVATTLCESCGQRRNQTDLTPAVERFAEPPPADPFDVFDDDLPVLQPRAAADYFRKLVPTVGVRPERYAPLFDRQAFTLAADADYEVLRRVKTVIQDAIEQGDGREAVRERIADVLDAAGVSPANPQYADLVYRTNAMDSYVQGQQSEYAVPAIQEAFPAWEYHAIPDERARPHHAARDGKLYPSSLTFQEVRGMDAHDVINCRCSWSPIHRRELERRVSAGEPIHDEG